MNLVFKYIWKVYLVFKYTKCILCPTLSVDMRWAKLIRLPLVVCIFVSLELSDTGDLITT